jgi:transposase-like protein
MIEAVRMVRGGQSMAAVAKILGISPKTLHNRPLSMQLSPRRLTFRLLFAPDYGVVE